MNDEGDIFFGIDFDVLGMSDTKWYSSGQKYKKYKKKKEKKKKEKKQGTQVEAKLVYMDLS